MVLSKLEKYNSSMQGQGEASFRVLYYGGATGSVPFVWESQPGTPKHKFNDNPPPPLTPPPSYQSSPRASPAALQRKHSKNSKVLNSIFAKKLSVSPSSSSSSSSLPSTPFHTGKSRSRSAAVHFGFDEDEYEPAAGSGSPTSTLCFGPRNAKFMRVKKVVKSIVRYGNSN